MSLCYVWIHVRIWTEGPVARLHRNPREIKKSLINNFAVPCDNRSPTWSEQRISTAERQIFVSRRPAEERCISPGLWRMTDLAARTKNVISHRAVQERRISPCGRRTTHLPRGWRTPYLTGRFKNDASRRADGNGTRILFLKFCSGSSARLRSRLSEYSFKKL